MLYSMTGFGRSVIEDADWTQTWEVKSVNGRHLDLKWRLPVFARSFEAALEKLVKNYAKRGRIEISLNLQIKIGSQQAEFDTAQATAMLDSLEELAHSRGTIYEPDYNALLHIPSLWSTELEEADDDVLSRLENGLSVAMTDWNESRQVEGQALLKDLVARILLMEEWVNNIADRAPAIRDERFTLLKERLNEALESFNTEVDENRLMQELVILTDKLDVSEELTRLGAHLERLRELVNQGGEAGRRLDFTLQECFREINTCGNKIQDAQLSRLVVDFKNELEKCREQVQNLE